MRFDGDARGPAEIHARPPLVTARRLALNSGARYHGGSMERLQKVLARAGIASRRKCEEYIVAGRVTVDGKVVRELGTKVDPRRSEIRCDGARLKAQPFIYFLVNKPQGVICSNASEAGRTRLVDLVGSVEQGLFTVGRLDVESEGLILLTNDGELANRLAHPRYEVPKVYVVDIDGALADEQLARLKKGVHLAEAVVRFDEVTVEGGGRDRSRLRVVVHQGVNREVRRAFAALGHEVRRLRRVAIGGLSDPDLRPGAYRQLSARELADLRRSVGLLEAES